MVAFGDGGEGAPFDGRIAVLAIAFRRALFFVLARGKGKK
jgi:hypothetical protein